jgi:beta-lactamase regulating signal transducer with metallopeptidase domain
MLLLPAGITKQRTPAQLDAILAHELCHWRHRDNLTAAIHMLVEALYRFHPLVGSDRHAYAEAILKLCQHSVGKLPWAKTCERMAKSFVFEDL